MRRVTTTIVLALAGALACSPGEKGDQGGPGDGGATGSDGATDGEGDGGDGGDGGDDGSDDGDAGDAGSGSDGDGEDGSATGGDGGSGSRGTDGTSSSGTTGGGGDLPDCGFDPGLAFNPTGDVLQFQSADESVCVRIERRDDGPGDKANRSYTLLEMQVGPLGEVSLVDDQADLCWYSSHHNHMDWAHAWTGTWHYDVYVGLDEDSGNPFFELHTFEQGPIDPDNCRASHEPEANGPIGDPIELFPYNP